MTEEEREEFLNYFEEEREGTLLGFCVMGGIFSEGIDLTDEKLIGAWVIGTGLPDVYKRQALYFVTCKGKMMYPTRMEEDYILRNLLDPRENLPRGMKEISYRQMSFFDDGKEEWMIR